MKLSRWTAVPVLSFFVFTLSGCSGTTSSMPPPPGPPKPTFTSTPPTTAAEGVAYSYQATATSSDSTAITFSLTTSPSGATLSGSTVSWTPTHAESRTSSSFTITATTAAGGSATQSWTVTPTGTVNITAVATYWTPSGSVNVPQQWPTGVNYPAALVPQSDGSLLRLQGAANSDGSFSIPNVPGGNYWLEINPNANYWTTASDFDDGYDVIGRPPATTATQSTTKFTSSISGINASTTGGDFFLTQTDLANSFSPAFGSIPANSTTFTSSVPVTSNTDWTKVTTLYLGQYAFSTSGSFVGYLLGPSRTISGVTFVNGAGNPISAILSSSPTVSLPLSISGSAWAALASSIGPGFASPTVSDYSVFAQPFATDRLALPASGLLGPNLTLLAPTAPPSTTPIPVPAAYACALDVVSLNFSLTGLGLALIANDVDYGTISFGDPYPAAWPRMFQYCQISTVTLPRPNSTATDTFIVTNKQTTALPTGPVTPILGPVQSPTANGGSLFQTATLGTTAVTISWSVPSTGQPYGYFVQVYQMGTLPSGGTGYTIAGSYGTAKTSVSIPFLTAGNTYVFVILAASDASANVATKPLRHRVPTAESAVISAPFILQ
jgi:hypothetical protein